MSANPPPNAAELRQVMFGLGLAMLLSALDQTIVVTAMPTIAADLGDPQDLPWIVTAYLIAATVVTPLYGKFADVYGRRRVILIGVITFVIGSVACALAPSMAALAGARVIQGLGGGGLISLAQTIVADLVSPRERGRYQSYFAAVFITSSIAGPALGGIFAQYWHWSLIFWINLPLGLAALLIVNSRLKRVPERRHPHRVDYLGAMLLIAGSGLLVLALGWGGVRYPWRSAPIVGLLTASALAWALFAWRTARAEEPLIPLRILRLRIVRDAILSSSFGLGGFVGLSVVMPIYYEICGGMNASESGLTLIPLMVGTVAGATAVRTIDGAFDALQDGSAPRARRRRSRRAGRGRDDGLGPLAAFAQRPAHRHDLRDRRDAACRHRFGAERGRFARFGDGDRLDAILSAARGRGGRRAFRRPGDWRRPRAIA